MKEEYLIQACTGKRVDVFKGQMKMHKVNHL